MLGSRSSSGVERARNFAIKVKKRVVKLDRINHEAHPKSLKGVIFTTIALLGVLGYGAWLAQDWFRKPLEAESAYQWANMGGPLPGPLFPMHVTCLAPSGCELTMYFAGASVLSAKCAGLLEPMCTSVAQDEMATVLACYSDLPTDGMYASFNGSGAAHFAGVGLRGTSPRPAVFDMRVLAGRTEVHLVNTTNESFAADHIGHQREEWFPRFLSDETKAKEAALAPCGSLVPPRSHTDVTQVVMDAQWVRVTVNSKDFIHLIGSVTGMWSLFLAAGALIYHLLTRRRKEVVEDDDGVRMRVEVDTWRGERAGAHSTRAERSVGHGGAHSTRAELSRSRVRNRSVPRQGTTGSVLTSPVLEEQGGPMSELDLSAAAAAPAAELELSTSVSAPQDDLRKVTGL